MQTAASSLINDSTGAGTGLNSVPPTPLNSIVDVNVARNSFMYEVNLNQDLGLTLKWAQDPVQKIVKHMNTQIGQVKLYNN